MSEAMQQPGSEAIPATEAATNAIRDLMAQNVPPWDPRWKREVAAQTRAFADAARADEQRVATAPTDPNLLPPSDPAGYGWNAEALHGEPEAMREAAKIGAGFMHKLGASRADASAIFEDARRISERLQRGVTEEQIAAEGERVVKATWGKAYDENLAKVRSLVRGTPGLAEWLEGTGMGNSPQMAAALLRIAQRRGRA